VKIAAALGWLENHLGWLMILDNVDDAPAVAAVAKLLARLSGGRHPTIASAHPAWAAAGREAVSRRRHLLSKKPNSCDLLSMAFHNDRLAGGPAGWKRSKSLERDENSFRPPARL
jgi:hypothetical protein